MDNRLPSLDSTPTVSGVQYAALLHLLHSELLEDPRGGRFLEPRLQPADARHRRFRVEGNRVLGAGAHALVAEHAGGFEHRVGVQGNRPDPGHAASHAPHWVHRASSTPRGGMWAFVFSRLAASEITRTITTRQTPSFSTNELHMPWSRASKRRSRLGKTTALSPTSWDHPEKCGASRHRRHPFGAVNCAILQMQHRSSGFSQLVPRNDPTSNLPLFPRPDSLFLSFRLDRMGNDG